MINVTIWNENYHERVNEIVREIHPNGMHNTLKNGLADPEFNIRTATMDEPNQGLPDEVLNNTDVLFWWGHCCPGGVDDGLVEKIIRRVNDGMGLIVLHSGHHSKLFTRLMGTTGNLRWREIGEHCNVWTVNPGHPITKGVPEMFRLEHEEMYGEPFGIPEPDEVVFISWFEGGDVFRSGVTYHRGKGKIFYFQPGHETYRSFYDENVHLVLKNAIRWAYNPDKFHTECRHIPEPCEEVTPCDLPGLTDHPDASNR